MKKTIILATSCCGKSTAVKECPLKCIDFDSAPYRSKNAEWKKQYAEDLLDMTEESDLLDMVEEYDVIFASYYDEVAAKISEHIETTKNGWNLHIVIPKNDPLVKQMIIGRMTLRDTENRYNRWVHRQIKQYDALTDGERIKILAPNAEIWQIDFEHPYITSMPFYQNLLL